MTAKTVKERQADFRQRKAEQTLIEVRGIFAHLDEHKKIKAYAEKLRRAKAAKEQ